MKILLVSMNSIHFTRWTQQLSDSGHELHWFNIRSGAIEKTLDFVAQHTDWRYRITKGRSWIKKIPVFNKFNERNAGNAFEKVLEQVKPDVVHSFAYHIAALPILEVMNQYPSIKWIYSSWGSDLFNSSNKPNHGKDLKRLFKRVDYLFTDCHRDHRIAVKHGFKGMFLGAFPGGGGFDINPIDAQRNHHHIALKAYENDLGKAVIALQALYQVHLEIPEVKVIAFGASPAFLNHLKAHSYPENFLLQVHQKIPRENLIQLFSSCQFYIGNSMSDGMPNTMLEAMFSGCIPIQSNPGGATAEVIKDGENGFLINDAIDKNHIYKVVLNALKGSQSIDLKEVKKSVKQFERKKVSRLVKDAYSKVVEVL